MDQASKGPLGALRALSSAKSTTNIAGPLLIILSLAFESFVQQAVSIHIPDSVDVVTSGDDSRLWVGVPGFSASLIDQRLIGVGIADSFANLQQTPRTSDSDDPNVCSQVSSRHVFGMELDKASSCQRAECRSAPYVTLEFCAQCLDQDPATVQACEADGTNCTWSLPWSHEDIPERDYDLWVDVKDPVKTPNFTTLSNVVAELGFVAWINASEQDSTLVNDHPVSSYRSVYHPCNITVCASAYVATSWKGEKVISETRVGSSQAFEVLDSDLVRIFPPEVGQLSNGTQRYASMSNGGTALNMTAEWIFALRRVFYGMLNGGSQLSDDQDLVFYYDDWKGSLLRKWLYPFIRGDDDAEGRVCDYFDDHLKILLANASQNLRSWLGSPMCIKTGEYLSYGEGATYSIQWGWLAFPILLQLCSIGYFVAVVLMTRKYALPLWKSSSLATSYHGIDPFYHADGVAADRVSEMEDLARSTQVRLIRSKRGYQLVAVDDEM